LNEIVAGVLRWVLRLVALAMGGVFVLSLLAAAAALALVWSIGALWARLTGRPVASWSMRVDPRAGWSTVRRSTARWTAPGAARARQARADVTDVTPREIH
jgi:hypothetical protein